MVGVGVWMFTRRWCDQKKSDHQHNHDHAPSVLEVELSECADAHERAHAADIKKRFTKPPARHSSPSFSARRC